MTKWVLGTTGPFRSRTEAGFGRRHDGDLIFSCQCIGTVSGKVVRACLVSQRSEEASRPQY